MPLKEELLSFNLKMSKNSSNHRSFENFFAEKKIQIIILGALNCEIIFALLKIKRKRKIDQRGLDPLELHQQFKLNDGGDTAVV